MELTIAAAGLKIIDGDKTRVIPIIHIAEFAVANSGKIYVEKSTGQIIIIDIANITKYNGTGGTTTAATILAALISVTT
jgi:hypothetical protein